MVTISAVAATSLRLPACRTRLGHSRGLIAFRGAFLDAWRGPPHRRTAGHAPARSLRPFFLGQDAWDLDRLLERVFVYNVNFRLSGMALGLPLATIEFAIFDMLGRLAGEPVGTLIGDIHHAEVAVYIATEWREAGGRGRWTSFGERGPSTTRMR